MSQSAITGKVAAIIDATTLILNVGAEQGVREGMLFAVVAAQSEIFDPDSGASLGPWEIVKARVVITHVQPRLSTARPPLLTATPASATLSEMMVRHSFGVYGDRSETGERPALDVVRGAVSGHARVAPIAIGDVVRSIALDQLVAPAASEPAGTDLPSQAYGARPATSVRPSAEQPADEVDPEPGQPGTCA